MKEFLTNKGLSFETRDVHSDAAAQADLMRWGIMSIPITVVDDGEPIVGADFARIESALAG